MSRAELAADCAIALHGQVVDDWSVGRVTKGQAEALLRHTASVDAVVPDPSRTNPRPVSWDWIDIGPDDQTLRIEFLEGVVDGLHHIEIDEDDDNVLVTVFVGLDPALTAGLTHSSGSPDGRSSRPTAQWRVGVSATALQG